jgi:hypothetical protein
MAFASCLFTTVCCTAALLVPHGVPPGRRPRAPVRSGGTLVAVGAAPPAVIVGGGIAGLSTALELAGRGFEVTVLSRDASAAATYAAGGMLAPQSERLDGDSPLLGLAVAARDYYPGWVRELEAASGVDVGLCASGGFLAPAMDGDVVHRWRPPAAGGTSLWLDRPAAAAMEPLLLRPAPAPAPTDRRVRLVGFGFRAYLKRRTACVIAPLRHDVSASGCAALGLRSALTTALSGRCPRSPQRSSQHA